MSSVRSNTFLGLVCVELENLVYMKVVEYFSTFLTNSYLHFSVEYSGSYDFCKFAVRYCRFQNSVNTFSFGRQFNTS
jgi:hypothetical protein